jgi:PAS domain S-box-containing protein
MENIEKEKFLTIIENLIDGLLVFDKENKLFLINNSAKKIFGFEEKFKGKSMDELSDFENFKNLFYLLGKEIREVFKEELEIGDSIFQVTSQPIFEKGEKVGTSVILREISREKAVEKMKTDFVTISAHQMRTPVSAINWALQLLLQEKFGKLTEEQKGLISQAYESNQRILRILEDLFNVIRMEEGKEFYKFSFVNFEELVNSVIKSYQEEIKKKKIKFEFQVLNKLPKVRVDAEKMAIAIQNLLDNAIRYNLPGGMVTITLKLNGKEIEFSIQDTGIGIPEKEKENIFKKFFRASNAIKMEPEGNGLGLFITKNIIQAHKGEIWLQSEEGKGSSFCFKIPIK